MAERALTEDAMLASLHDIRLPSDAPGGLLAEGLAAGGLGLLLALGVAGLVVLLTRLNPAAIVKTDTNSGESGAVGDDARRRRLLRQLKDAQPKRFAALAPDLYRKGGLPEIDALERMIDGDA
jgi:hypothetical protein